VRALFLLAYTRRYVVPFQDSAKRVGAITCEFDVNQSLPAQEEVPANGLRGREMRKHWDVVEQAHCWEIFILAPNKAVHPGCGGLLPRIRMGVTVQPCAHHYPFVQPSEVSRWLLAGFFICGPHYLRLADS